MSGHPDNIILWLNRGPAVTLPGVELNWIPTSPSGATFGFDNGGPSANNFAPGVNNMQIQVGTGLTYQQPMNLRAPNPSALQLYLFADNSSGSRLHYVLLSGGNVVDTDLTSTLTFMK
ncbi:MAG: hypothetical protein JWM95_4416 [Gemmatimonadetes bacterium]|nr:hypothetical protein [Gemmatimonadota bacterium]